MISPEPTSDDSLPSSPRPATCRHEFFTLLLIIIAFVLINFFTADKGPVVWTDEVMYEDPAVNLYQGHGFTSAAWYAQTMDKFWAGNVPLYQFVLFGWLKIFGFSLTSVRSLHYVLVGLAVLIAWAAVRRLGLIRSPAHRLVFCLLLLLSSGVSFDYRGARPESLCMTFTAGALFSFSLRPRSLRLAMLTLTGALLICTGLQMGPYLFLLCGLFWLVGPRNWRLEFSMICAGCVAGLGLLYVFYASHGAWNDFIASVRRHTIANEGVHYDIIAGYDVSLKNKFETLPGVYKDYSFLVLMAVAAWMSWRLWRAHLPGKSSLFLFSILAALLVPPALHFIGVFPSYYSWMAFAPLALGVCAELNRQFTRPLTATVKFSVICLLALTCLLGLPRRLAVAAFEWQARSYEPIMKLAAPYVPPQTWVLAEQSAYYAAKQYGATVILPTHYGALRDEDKSRITIAIVRNTDAARLTHDFGGEWHEVAAYTPPPARSPPLGLHEFLDNRQYHLKVFVRDR